MTYFKSSMNREILNAIISTILFVFGYFLHITKMNNIEDIFFIASFLIGGYYKAKEGFVETIENKKLNVELLMVIAALVSISQGHYEEAAVLIIIFAISGALESYTEAKSSHELESLVKLQPNKARVIENDDEKIIDITQLKIGQFVKVLAGEQITADGIIMQKALVNEAMLTGESLPVLKEEGSEVFAGTINLDGPLIIQVTKETKDNTISKIVSLIEQSKTEKPEIQNKIETIENIYVYLVIVGAILIFLIFQDASKAATFLVIASPCAIVASVMPVVLGSVANLAKQGLIVKSGKKVIELSKVKNIFFDKTGTITDGKHKIYEINGKITPKDWDIIATIEANSTHPLSQAITKYQQFQKVELKRISEKPGYGLEGEDFDNNIYYIGSRKYINEKIVVKITNENKDNIFIAKNNQLLASIKTLDSIREKAKEVMQDFAKYHIDTHIISGDDQINVERVNDQIHATTAKGFLLPNQKINELEKKRKLGLTAMVGDGINDGPVIAASNIGIAMGNGSDLALETADIIITKSDFGKISKLLKISKKANVLINQNLIFATLVIVGLTLFNFFTTIKLPLAVVSHEGSTILVILNSLRILKYERDKK